MKSKVLVAMSGGVDSSVAAFLLKQQGYECIGATMHLFSGEDDNADDAHRICEKLDIPFHVFDCVDEFKTKVIDSFVNAYENGLTPNPCIQCNKFLKFGMLYDKASELGCDHIATGHYVITERSEDNAVPFSAFLKKAKDKTKDQSYFLYSLSQEQLRHTLFPLGMYDKAEIRKIAEDNGFVNAKRRDSQDVCFISDGKYAEFIISHTGRDYPEGDFIDINGNVLGRHKGIINYTIGQRKGLGIALNEPMYVKEVNIKDNTVMLARDCELFSDELYADNLNFIAGTDKGFIDIDMPMRVKAKIRYRHLEADATACVKNGIMNVKFDEPQRAVTKGQAVVLYKDDYVVGGGTII